MHKKMVTGTSCEETAKLFNGETKTTQIRFKVLNSQSILSGIAGTSIPKSVLKNNSISLLSNTHHIPSYGKPSVEHKKIDKNNLEFQNGLIHSSNCVLPIVENNCMSKHDFYEETNNEELTPSNVNPLTETDNFLEIGETESDSPNILNFLNGINVPENVLGHLSQLFNITEEHLTNYYEQRSSNDDRIDNQLNIFKVIQDELSNKENTEINSYEKNNESYVKINTNLEKHDFQEIRFVIQDIWAKCNKPTLSQNNDKAYNEAHDNNFDMLDFENFVPDELFSHKPYVTSEYTESSQNFRKGAFFKHFDIEDDELSSLL